MMSTLLSNRYGTIGTTLFHQLLVEFGPALESFVARLELGALVTLSSTDGTSVTS